MSSSDVADIQATLQNLGVTATPEEITNKLNYLATFRVTGAEAKRNVIRCFARSAGIDPSALYKGNSAPVRIADIKEDGRWVTLRVKVVQLWDPTSGKIAQTGS